MKYKEEEISAFLSACDNMVASKFILVNKRIGDLLKSIAITKPVYNAIAEDMINFNFSSAWKNATANSGALAINYDRFIAFVFCMLKAIDESKININDLLVKYFPSDEDKRSSYSLFCEKIIVPFKNIIVNRLCGEEKPEVVQQKQPETSIIDNSINERINFLVKDVKAYVAGIKKIKNCPTTKQEYISLIDAFLLAISRVDYCYYNYFATAILALSGKDKELKRRIYSIIELLASIKE